MNTTQLALLGSLALGLGACGGVIRFEDATPIRVAAVEPKRVEVKQDRIELTEKIQFELDRSDIKSESHGLLNEIVAALKDHPAIKKIQIIGHTDSDGEDGYNQELSDRRAKAVMGYLTDHGIETARLSAIGRGESEPIADNADEDGKEKNRRVEFLITEQEGT